MISLSVPKVEKIIQRTAELTVAYIFELIDSDGNNLIEESEWIAFITALFPNDVNMYGPLFKEVNEGKPFDLL